MAACSLVLPAKITELIDRHLPVKSGWLGILSYVLFYSVNQSVLEAYEQLIVYTAVLVAFIEFT